MIAALTTYLALLLTWAAFDYAGFGLVATRQRWGDPTQRRPWDTLPLWQQATYRVVQKAFILATAYAALSVSVPGTLAAFAAAAFAVHDLAYHVVGGHVGSGRWRPFGLQPKRKPWSLHYWPLRLLSPYPSGIPYRWETWGRIGGFALVTVTLALYTL